MPRHRERLGSIADSDVRIVRKDKAAGSSANRVQREQSSTTTKYHSS